MKSILISAAAALAFPLAALSDPAYMIAQIQVDDWDKFMGVYGEAALPSIIEHGAKILVGGPGATVVEGNWVGNHTVVLEFESMEKAQAWYNSDAYTAARPLRYEFSSENNIVFANAFVMPE